MNISNNSPLIVEKFPVAKDSLKFANTHKEFSIVDDIPSSMSMEDEEDNTNSQNKINDITSTMKALQVARKSISDAQSVVKDIKSNYKVDKNDEYSPIDDTMLKQRYEALLEIKEIFNNALYKRQNVFQMDFSEKNVNIDFSRNSLSSLNIRDGHSIDIFSYNLDVLGKQIDSEVANLQKQIDSINSARWLSQIHLRGIPLEQKSINVESTPQVPNLASLLSGSIESNKEASTASVPEMANENSDISLAGFSPDSIESNADSKSDNSLESVETTENSEQDSNIESSQNVSPSNTTNEESNNAEAENANEESNSKENNSDENQESNNADSSNEDSTSNESVQEQESENNGNAKADNAEDNNAQESGAQNDSTQTESDDAQAESSSEDSNEENSSDTNAQ